MKRIGIITLNGYFNYGNRLQNYALERVLEKMGCEVNTIKVKNSPLSTKKKTNKIQRIRGMNFRKIVARARGKTWDIIHRNEKRKSNKVRTDTFKKFTDDYISEIDYSIFNEGANKSIADSYDFFVVGSDQVWNPFYNYGSSVYFLDFAPKGKRISYAASFGISLIPDHFKEKYKRFLGEMRYLSVREDSGAQIIENLTGRDACVHVDPTMLLTKDEWIGISRKATHQPNEKYLLTYFLGGIPKEHKKMIERIAEDEKLRIINLGDIREKDSYRTGPSEFINYIDDCSIFCTDSFHGAVFSILLEKPFVVYDRVGSNSMYSRIDTLLDKFDLTTRKAESISTLNDLFNIDFSHVPPILEMERNKSFDYLKNALKIRDDKTHES
ncbi:MAG: polysaccharide pyruvyl transferase family protein [Erysipelothrix sp.]|nr:polysaccharide pyruvyl transferase family protein [Erysipelothrix sp.]